MRKGDEDKLTIESRALKEEIEYGVGKLGLPVIVVYPDFDPIRYDGMLDSRVYGLWDKLPSFKRLMGGVPTMRVPMEKEPIAEALGYTGYMVQSKIDPGTYRT